MNRIAIFLLAGFLSHASFAVDIVSLSPGPGDSTRRLAEALARLKDGGTLRLEKGTYLFRADAAERLHLEPSNNASGLKRVIFPLVERHDVTVDGGGSTFLFGPQAFPFAVLRSTGVTLKNFRVTCETAPCVSGTVTSKDDAGFGFRLDSGSAPMDLSSRHISLHSLDRQRQCFFRLPGEADPPDWIPTRYMSFTPEDRGGGDWYMRAADDSHPKCVTGYYDVGERVAFNLAGNRDVVFCFAEDARDLRLADVRVSDFGGMGVMAQRSENVTLERYVVVPEGQRPVTLTADASHFVNCRGVIRLEDCEMSWGLDDVCNVHGNYLETVGVAGREAELKVGHFEQRGFFPYRVGETVEFVERRRRDVLIRATVASVRPLSSDRVLVGFVEDVSGIPVGALVEDVSACPDVIIRNCSFHDYPHLRLSGRGRIVVEGNRFERASVGLFAFDLAEYWYESGRLADLVIRNNVFDGCTLRGSVGTPAVRIGLTGWKPTDVDIPQIHGRVRLENNVFRNLNGGKPWEACGVRTFTETGSSCDASVGKK